MPRDYKVYLDDILQAVRKIRRYTAGAALRSLAEDEKTFDAVVRNLEIIGEASKKIPDEIREQHADVDWKKIASLRDILNPRIFRDRPGDHMGRGAKQAAGSRAPN